jgi:hypothetical protein
MDFRLIPGKPFIFHEMLIGAVGIELKATLKARKLLILLNGKNGKNTEFTQVGYTAGTRAISKSTYVVSSRLGF